MRSVEKRRFLKRRRKEDVWNWYEDDFKEYKRLIVFLMIEFKDE